MDFGAIGMQHFNQMKKNICLIVLVFLSFGVYSQSIIGKWYSNIDGEKGYFIFDSLGYATMVIGNEEMGGKNSVLDGRRCFMKYTLNETSKPFKLDMILYDFKSKKEIRRMLAIYEFLPNNKINICLDTENGLRPSNFKSKDNCLVLDKVK